MLRIIFVLFTALFIAACASAPHSTTAKNIFSPYTLTAPPTDSSLAPAAYVGAKAYRLGKVLVVLDQHQVNKNFPDEAALKEVFSGMVQSRLAAKNLLAAENADAIEVNLDLRYKRVFMGEAFGFSKGFAGSRFSYASALLHKNAELAHYQSIELAVTGGLLRNLTKIGKDLSASGSPADELAELNIYADAIVANLPH